MKAQDLLVSSVNITEDDYSYKALFILNYNNKSLNCDLSEIDEDKKIEEIISFFTIDDSVQNVRTFITSMVIEKASIVSKIIQGEEYNKNSLEKAAEKSAADFDLA